MDFNSEDTFIYHESISDSCLPTELFPLIFSYCDCRTLLTLRCVNKYFLETINLSKYNLRSKLDLLLNILAEMAKKSNKNFLQINKKDLRAIQLLNESSIAFRDMIVNMLLQNDTNNLLNNLNFPINDKYESIIQLIEHITKDLHYIDNMIPFTTVYLPSNFNITELYLNRYNYMITSFMDHTIKSSELIKFPLLKQLWETITTLDQYSISIKDFSIFVTEICKYVENYSEIDNVIGLLYVFCDFPTMKCIYACNINLLGLHFGDVDKIGNNIINMYKQCGFTGFMNLYDAATIIDKNKDKYLTRFSRSQPENIVITYFDQISGKIKNFRYTSPDSENEFTIIKSTRDPIKVKVQITNCELSLKHVVHDSGYLVAANE